MLLARYEQQTTESKLRDIDASRWLRDGELVSSVAVTVTRMSGPTPAGDDLECTTAIVAGTLIKFTASGGDNLAEYKIEFLITTNLQVREDEVFIRIRNI